MQVSPINFNNTSFGISVKKEASEQQKSSYEKGLDEIILDGYGKMFKIHQPEDYDLFVSASKDFKKRNAQLLEDCGIKVEGPKDDGSYNRDLNNLILKEFGNIFVSYNPEACEKFEEAIGSFMEGNSELLQKHFDVVA